MNLREIIKKHRLLNNPTSRDLVDFIIDTAKDIISQRFIEIEDNLKDQLEELKDNVQTEILQSINEIRGKTYKGDKGDPPKDEELLTLIRPLIPPLIPSPLKGDSPTDRELLKLIKPLIPRVKDGHTPTKEELLKIIKPLIPLPIKGDSGSPDTPEQIAKKVNTLEEKIEQKTIKGLANIIRNLQLSIQDIKRVKSGGGMGNVIVETPSGTINGSNKTFTLTTQPKTNALILTVNGQVQRKEIDFTINGKTITMLWDIPTGSDIFCWFIR